MKDIDVYIASADQAAALAVFTCLGWRLESPCVDTHLTHAATFRAPDGVAAVDLHWWPMSAVRVASPERTLLANIGRASALQLRAKVPDSTSQLIITLVHGAEPNPEPPVRWAADALLILVGDQVVDWGRVVEFARAHQAGLRLGRMLDTLDTIVGDLVPRSVISDLAALPVWPIERWERRMMDSAQSSLAMRVSRSMVVGSAAERTASSTTLWIRLLRRYHETWQVPWLLLPAAAAARLIRYLRRR
jgi:hypothetical protein